MVPRKQQTKQKQKETEAEKEKPKTIDWLNSESKQVVLDDLQSGLISLDTTDTAHDLYYGMYQFAPEFIAEGVQYNQFRARFNDHRKAIKKQQDRSEWETAALAHDRLIFPKKTHNARGERVFYMTDAARQLAQDVEDQLHVTLKPSGLRALRQDLYGEWPLKTFDQRIRQAVQRKKFVNYLSDKRLEKEMERKEKRKALKLPEETPKERYERQQGQDGT